MNSYCQEDDYFSRLDHKIVLPFPSKYDIEVVFYNYMFKIYKKFAKFKVDSKSFIKKEK